MGGCAHECKIAWAAASALPNLLTSNHCAAATLVCRVALAVTQSGQQQPGPAGHTPGSLPPCATTPAGFAPASTPSAAMSRTLACGFPATLSPH